ncbi:PLP-dependent aminotransferase family protein [Streptomyces javensis]|uniref:aminotransferase-like domain-containing protein n=1 Tax=Streptomyces javensis TaxID=114698 RepID=UPI0033FE381A
MDQPLEAGLTDVAFPLTSAAGPGASAISPADQPPAAPAHRTTVLGRTAVSDSVRDPALRSLNFLNEIMARHPEAISFAPGAPHPRFYEDLDPDRHIDSFLGHLVRSRGLSPDQARLTLHQYGPTAGLINDLVAELLRSDLDIHASPESIVITVGCQEAMYITLRALRTDADDVVLVTSPGYSGVVGAALMAGIGLRTVPEGENGWDIAALREACRQLRARGRRPRAVHCVPDFANPSGARLNLADRAALLRLAEEEDLLVLEDGVYAFTAPPERRLPSLKAMDRTGRVVHLGSFAKVCMPGVRVGYVVADQLVRDERGGTEPLAAMLTAIKSMVTVNTAALSQAVVGGLLVENGGSLHRRTAEQCAFYDANRRRLLAALERAFPQAEAARHGVRWTVPEGGFFVVLTVPFEVDDALLEVSARTHRVLWTPMRHFHRDGREASRRLRLSFSYLDPPRIDEGVARLAEFIRQRSGGA